MISHNHHVDALVLDGSERQSLVAVRSLGSAGVRVGVVASSRWAPAFHSRWCRTHDVVTDVSSGTDAWLAGVLDAVERHRPRVMLCTTDGSLEVLRAHRDAVERSVRLPISAEPALGIALDKTRTIALARQLGLAVPRTLTVRGVADARAAVAELGLPLVVKPATSWMETEAGGARLGPRLAVDQVEALAAVSLVEQSGGVAILQQWIGGRREAVSVFRAGGRVVARFAQVAYRMVPPLGGSSVVRESIPLPADLTTAADALATASGLEGYAEIEFRRDLEGRPYLMEINPRLSASVEIAVRCGVDFPRLLYTWAIGGELADQANPRVGVRMRWLGGDVRWLSETLRSPNRPDVERRSRALSTFATDFIRPAHYDYVALNDPKPAVLATASFIKWHARAAVRTAPKAT